ncbi:uncharacterized protein LOC121534643 [Coregonus clupeaformis]|uniref:uncharacterized protein LOC121534643 n=1 Tax=Coregonus clupeaformis TaxID=59861 RepID=UPI001E1C4215|nr:uncharacterized protein LOC121534643 [Coregonus clupeaformis]
MSKHVKPLIPNGLMAILAGFSRAYLRKRPTDFGLFAMYYCMELRKYRDEIPAYSPNMLVKEFHKHRAERLCGNAYEEELLKYGYKVTSKEDVTFNALEITSQDLQILGSRERRINRQYSTTTSPCGEQVNNITAPSAMEQQVNQTLGAAAMELGALVGNIDPTTSTSPVQPTNNNANNTQHVVQASSQAVAGLESTENKTGEVAPQVKPGSAEILASSSEASISGHACAPQHYTPISQEGVCACAPMPTEIPCYPRFPQNYPPYPPPPPYLPGLHHYLDLMSGQYVQPSCRCQLYGRVVYRPPSQPVLPQCHHAAPLPLPQCTHQHLSPSASCIQVTPTMGPSCPYGEQSPFSRYIPVPVLTNHFGSLYYRPRIATGVPGCRSECLPTSRRLSCTSCNVSDSSSCGPEPAAQASCHGGYRGQCGGDANHGPVPAGALRSLYAPVPCPIGLQRRDAPAQRPCSAPTRRVVPLTTQNQNSPFPSE